MNQTLMEDIKKGKRDVGVVTGGHRSFTNPFLSDLRVYILLSSFDLLVRGQGR